jgi:tRNA threonylcarbamoyladenosine biosynthesis protein TsaB
LAAKLVGQPCRIVGPQAEALAQRIPNAVAQQTLPDPVLLARLAMTGGIEGWRARNRAEGLPRPLYLRGVNVTSPDGTRRTVE